MDRYLLQVNLLVQVDVPDGANADDIPVNFYARLSELVQSEDHMLDAEVICHPLAGNSKPSAEVAIR